MNLKSLLAIVVFDIVKQARSQKFTMGGCLEGLGAKPPAAGGWGLPPETRGSGGRAPSARKFGIFLQK